MVAHGLSVALLFLLTHEIHTRTGTLDMTQMGGLVKRAPVLAAFFSAAILASIGLPGFAGFWGELTIFVSVWSISKTVAALALLGVVISAVYGLRAVAKVFFGESTEIHQKYAAANPRTDIEWSARVPALVLLAALFFIGFWPKAISTPLNDTLGSIYPAVEAAVKVAAKP
jgi:NADH-quinone oxidoreductase subunit M